LVRRHLQKIIIACIFILSIYTSCGVNIFTTQDEIEIGKNFSQEIDKTYPILENNPDLAKYVDQLGQKLVKVCDRHNITYTFKIVNDTSVVNAFALPGGYIYIYTGLMKLADNEAELAGVVAHEIGHIVARHGMKRMTQLYGYQILSALVLGPDTPQWQSIVSDLIAGMGILKYGRENEYEADRLGVTYIYRAGYDPYAMVTFFKKMDEMHKRGEISKFEQLFSTHPPTNNRIGKIQSTIKTFPDSTQTTLNKNVYEAVKILIP